MAGFGGAVSLAATGGAARLAVARGGGASSVSVGGGASLATDGGARLAVARGGGTSSVAAGGGASLATGGAVRLAVARGGGASSAAVGGGASLATDGAARLAVARGGRASSVSAGGEASLATGGAVRLAVARGGGASSVVVGGVAMMTGGGGGTSSCLGAGRASESGGASEVWHLALSVSPRLIDKNPMANSAAFFIRIGKTARSEISYGGPQGPRLVLAILSWQSKLTELCHSGTRPMARARNDSGWACATNQPVGQNFASLVGQISGLSSRVPPDKRGVRTSRTRGGMRWTFVAPDDGVDERTAKPCGPGTRCRCQAVGEA